MEEVNSVLRQFWEIDSSGTTTLPVMTKVEQLLLDRVEKSVRFSENHYQIAIPWKEELLQLPNNYRMALNRLETLEKWLKKYPQTTAAYGEVILTHLKRVMLGKLMNYLREKTKQSGICHISLLLRLIG